MNKKIYQLYCELCSYKKITDGSDIDCLAIVKTAKIQSQIPILDPIKKQKIESTYKSQKMRFKCPQCGRVIKPKLLLNPEENNETNNTPRRETST